MKKEIPILFSTMMVQALLAGRKTQTRRIIKPQPSVKATEIVLTGQWPDKPWCARFPYHGKTTDDGRQVYEGTDTYRCPYGKIGDVLWVREGFAYTQFTFDKSLIVGKGEVGVPDSIIYKADDPEHEWDGSYKPSIHMPKEAARIWLQVEDVRVERLQRISNADCIAEGIEPRGEHYRDYTSDSVNHMCDPWKSIQTLWYKIHGVGSWNENPWLWVVSFKVLSTTGRTDAVSEVPSIPSVAQAIASMNC